MIRVLQVFGRMDRGGAEAMIMELYRHIDRTKLQFDFVVHTTDKCSYDDEILSLGGRIFSVPLFKISNLFRYKSSWKKLLLDHPEWTVVHGHVRSTASIYLPIAKQLGRYTIAHSHNTSSGSGIDAVIKNHLQKRINADYYFACSNDAGKWLFGSQITQCGNYSVLHNAIDTEYYSFDENVRSEVRKKLGFNGELVVGNVGNLYDQKNQSFLLDVFNKLQKYTKSRLVIVGDGPLRAMLEKKASDLQLSEKVIFTGVRDDVNLLLQAMDVFVFPSKFEGLGIAVIEAQTSGLPTVISNGVPEESILVNDLVAVKRLDETADQWANCILSMTSKQRKDHSKEIVEKGYDIKSTSRWLEEFYFEKSKSL